jgi:DNA-binding MarR family transcriptional regulator
VSRTKIPPAEAATDAILRHWREAVPNDRLAHLIKDATRGLVRALQMRLAEHSVSFGHWTFLRILWETDGLTQRELSVQAGVMEPTTFAALKAMEKLGYIMRRRRPDNRKNVHVFLTPRGRALKAKLVPLAEEVNEIAVRWGYSTDVDPIPILGGLMLELDVVAVPGPPEIEPLGDWIYYDQLSATDG